MKLEIENSTERACLEAVVLKLLDFLQWTHPMGCPCAVCFEAAKKWSVEEAGKALSDYLAGRPPINAQGFREPPPANGHGGPA